MASVPAFLHCTHAKAGSTWIDKILRGLFGKKNVTRVGSDALNIVCEPGMIYSGAFLARDKVLTHPGLSTLPRFVVIRDLRDALISRYFSVRYSHPLDPSGAMERRRQQMESLSKEDGLAEFIATSTAYDADLQRSWLGHGERVLRYEDLLADDLRLLGQLFLDEMKLPIEPAKLEEVVVANRFENVYGRKLGETDPQSHGRQGAPGDWKNHLTPRLRAEIASRYGDVLIATGYERDNSWV